ncbi:MAG: ATP-binding protein [Planctomycetales bacterium]|nr:ATP-binding protein [Planctomycetales bacterium]
MGKSLRLRLLAWYAAILAGVLGAFGAVLYTRLEASLLREVEAELTAHVQALAHEIEDVEDDAAALDLGLEYVRYFRPETPGAPSYAHWDGGGRRVGGNSPPDLPRPEAPGFRDSGDRREISVATVTGGTMLVGRSIREERERLAGLLWLLAGTGAGVFALAMLGGFLLAGRALAPIRKITETAAAISAEDLSRRIDVGRTESELGTLARTLNDAFARIEASFERQTRFTADASHELRTPLSILLTHVELALKKDRTAPEYRETLETCLRAAQRMRATEESLLTLARADAGELKVARDRVDLKPVVEETVALLAPLATERRVAVAVEASPLAVAGDRERLREVATNLVTNALRYNREGGRVEVRLSRENGAAVLSVADTGIGIPEPDRAHLFERFYRVDKARSRELGGSGLGLAITRWIVEAHGGTIAVASREGEGTTFTVRLPAAVATPQDP